MPLLASLLRLTASAPRSNFRAGDWAMVQRNNAALIALELKESTIDNGRSFEYLMDRLDADGWSKLGRLCSGQAALNEFNPTMKPDCAGYVRRHF